MNLSEVSRLVRVARPPAPHGAQTLARCYSIEDVAAQTSTPPWFQLYLWGDRGETKEAIARARAAGFSALHPGWAWHFLTSDAISFPNIGPPGHRSRDKLPDMFDGTVCWEDLDWIRELWDGPILAKGVMRASEAVRAADDGLDGVIVSNRGGRQLDHLPATIDVLPEIVDAAAAGERGMRHCIDILADELRMTMALCGARNLAELNRDLIRHRQPVN